MMKRKNSEIIVKKKKIEKIKQKECHEDNDHEDNSNHDDGDNDDNSEENRKTTISMVSLLMEIKLGWHIKMLKLLIML